MRVERSFAFIDLCGFTAFTDRQPDERVVLVLAQLRTALRETAARRGVRVVKWLGVGRAEHGAVAHPLHDPHVPPSRRLPEGSPHLGQHEHHPLVAVPIGAPAGSVAVRSPGR